jgi:hypothetical protein
MNSHNQTSHSLGPSRRTALAGGLAIAVAAVGLRIPRAGAATPGKQRWTRSRSANGWPVLDSFETVTVEGSGVVVPLAGGVPATILTHLARRFHYEIDTLRDGDLRGGTTDRSVLVAEQSNYLSGTALEVRPGSYPVGQRGNLFPNELVVIEDMLAECEGVVGWGGDLSVPMEGHFQIDLPPTDARVRRLAERFGYIDTIDSPRGAGAVDAFDPARRAKARKFRQQGGR